MDDWTRDGVRALQRELKYTRLCRLYAELKVRRFESITKLDNYLQNRKAADWAKRAITEMECKR